MGGRSPLSQSLSRRRGKKERGQWEVRTRGTMLRNAPQLADDATRWIRQLVMIVNCRSGAPVVKINRHGCPWLAQIYVRKDIQHSAVRRPLKWRGNRNQLVSVSTLLVLALDCPVYCRSCCRSASFVSVGSSRRLAASLPRDLVTAITPAFDALYAEALGLASFRLSWL